MAQDAPRRRPARPVADAPVDALLAHCDELAKAWLLALLDAAPLQRAPSVLTEALTREGPRVCEAAVRALADDRSLRVLESGGALRSLGGAVGPMTGARGPADASRAVDALHDVLWAALGDELRRPDAELVIALAQRLARVCAAIRDAALESEAGAAPAGAIQRAAPTPPATVAGGADSVPLWMSALADEVRGARATARPLSLLLAELEDADRALVCATAERAGTALREFGTRLRGALRSDDILVWESESRFWVIARGTDRAAAHLLGARIAEAVGESGPLGGAPLTASVGVAVLGEDGAGSHELIDAAEEARFRASARGVEVSRRAPARPMA